MKAPISLLSQRGRNARLSILVFHRVLASADARRPALPDAVQFEQCMRWVQSWFNVLPLSEAARRLESGDLPARPLSITFDDGYADNESVAMPILSRYSLPATFFVCTGFLDGGRMWNDDVIESIRAVDEEQVDFSGIGLGVFNTRTDEERRLAIKRIIASIKHLPYGERAKRVDDIVAHSGGRRGPELMMTRAQVARLHKAGMTIGGHTVNHPILARLSSRAALEEIASAKEQLEEIIGERVTTFAYPNGVPGLDYTAEHAAMVRSCGFECAVSTAWGVSTFNSDRYQLPRFTPWSKSRLRFGIQLARNLLRTDFATV